MEAAMEFTDRSECTIDFVYKQTHELVMQFTSYQLTVTQQTANKEVR